MSPLTCRICQSGDLLHFLSLGAQPLANRFVRPVELRRAEEVYPLEVYFCLRCNLAQLPDVVGREALFREYIYLSSPMPRLSDYFRHYAEDVMQRFLTQADFVLEIASNDGVLLKAFQSEGYRVLGVDPASNVARIANAAGIETLNTFFSKAVAEQIVKERGRPKVVMANNVVAHIDDHQDLGAAIAYLIANEGVFIFEAPYLVDMFDNLTYDTIYHEHLSLLALRPLAILFERFDLELFDVQIHPVQGQSLRGFVAKKGSRAVSGRVAEYIAREVDLGLNNPRSFEHLAWRIRESKVRLLALLNNLKGKGMKLAAYGAPAKGNTLLNYCGIGTDVLDYAIDDLPAKQGLFTPGTRIPVVSREFASNNPPDYYLLLAWNYSAAILEREKAFRTGGGKFIIPVGDSPQIL